MSYKYHQISPDEPDGLPSLFTVDDSVYLTRHASVIKDVLCVLK